MPLELINNPARIDGEFIERVLGQGKRVTLQYSEACYSKDDLRQINRLCDRHDGKLRIRFYSHVDGGFDATVLSNIPGVKNLSLDCLLELRNAGEMEDLGNLRQFRFGVHHWDDPLILSRLDLAGLEGLVVSENHRNNIDLSPIARSTGLRELFISGQSKGIECLEHLPELRRLSLGSIPKYQHLDFVAGILSLEKLTIVLGGRNGRLDVSHPALRDLEILRVRGLDALDPDLFPELRSLLVEDQLQLQQLRIGANNRRLESLRIQNCKNLKLLEGLGDAVALRELFVGRTALHLGCLLSESLPESLGSFSFYTGRLKMDRQIREQLDSLGYAGR